MNEINIIDYIPRGHENGISKGNLSMVTSLPERAVRKAINKHNASGKETIVNVSDGFGYFLIGAGEEHYLYEYIGQESSRARLLMQKVEGVQKYAASIGGTYE